MKQLTQEQLNLIKKPLPKEAVMPHPTKPNLSTIKAIYVTERFNEVFGVGAWKIKASLIGDISEKTRTTSSGRERTEYTAVVKTIFAIPEYSIYYECIASSTNDDMGDAAKGATTDAITKIASWIGIGIDVFKGQQEAALNRENDSAVLQAIEYLKAISSKDNAETYCKGLPVEVKNSATFRAAAKEHLSSLKTA